jgi:catechol 2,3-dioxygenase-like lactoylglutathione lyase family enzyme
MFRVIPELTVDDMQRSMDFYCGILDFQVSMRDEEGHTDFVSLEKEDAALFLVTEGSRDITKREALKLNKRGVGVRLYFEVEDARALHEELKTKELADLGELSYNQEEDYTEFTLIDPDGYCLGFYS